MSSHSLPVQSFDNPISAFDLKVANSVSLLQRCAQLVGTGHFIWPLGARIAAALVLLIPEASRLSNVLDLCSSAPCPIQATLLLHIEVVLAASLLAGAFMRVAAIPAMVLLAVKALSSFAAEGWVIAVLSDLIRPSGDWAFGVGQIGAIVLLRDVVRVGAGRCSVDFYLGRMIRWVQG